MFRNRIIEPIGFILTAGCFLFSLILFYSESGVFGGSFAAALIAAGLFWIMYVIVRMIVLTFRS